jgi:tartrate dehydrogenase/decarboxylase/D-malate dehydrogenase
MMLEHLGHPQAAADMMTAIEAVLKEPSALTPDLGGHATTSELGKAIAEAI